MEIEKVLNDLNTIEMIFKTQVNNLKYGTLVRINNFENQNINQFTSEISTNTKQINKIITLCNSIINLYNSIKDMKQNYMLYYSVDSITRETFLLLTMTDNRDEWRVLQGTLDSSKSRENNKFVTNTQLLCMTFTDRHFNLENSVLLHYVKNILKVCESQPQQKEPQKFNSNYSDDCLKKILLYLIKKSLMPATDAGLWLYWFNRNPKYNNPTQLKLNSKFSPTLLANVMQTICGEYQTVSAKNAIEKLKIVRPAIRNDRPNEVIKDIMQFITIDKQTKQ